MMTKD